VVDSCEHGNEPSGTIKCGEFLDQLGTRQLIRKNSASLFVCLFICLFVYFFVRSFVCLFVG